MPKILYGWSFSRFIAFSGTVVRTGTVCTTKIIQRITKVKKEDRLNILLKASPIISNLKDPKWENICHIIDDTDKIPTIKDPSWGQERKWKILHVKA